MRLAHGISHHKQTDIRISGWDQGILMPKNMNMTNMNVVNCKTIVQINRKQFVQRRRRHQRQNSIENYQQVQKGNSKDKHKMQLAKKYTTIDNEHFSSIKKLRKQMQNIQKIKDRWQQMSTYTDADDIVRKTQKKWQSGLIKCLEEKLDDQNQGLEMTRIKFRQVRSCRENRKRPESSYRTNQKYSMTLSQKYNERSKTIHSRGTNRMLSCNNRNSKQLRSKSNKLNIAINQLQGKQMQSILKILLNHS